MKVVEAAAVAETLAAKPKLKRKRRSYAPGTQSHDDLETAALGWPLAKSRGVSLMQYCRTVEAEKGISVNTLKPYIYAKPERQLAGVEQRGRPALLVEEQQQVVADTMASADMGDEGKSRRTAIDMVSQLNPALTTKQAANHYDNTIQPKAKKGGVLSGTVSAQGTTSMRAMVTPRQQRRWHATVEEGRAELIKRNVDDGTGVRYVLKPCQTCAWPDGSVLVSV